MKNLADKRQNTPRIRRMVELTIFLAGKFQSLLQSTDFIIQV